MRRTLIQFDEPLYQQLRTLAFEKGVSFSSLVRDLLAKALGAGRRKKKMRIDQFKFIGAGRSKEGNIAENHDDYIAEDILK